MMTIPPLLANAGYVETANSLGFSLPSSPAERNAQMQNAIS
jgi:hypothetical protein